MAGICAVASVQHSDYISLFKTRVISGATKIQNRGRTFSYVDHRLSSVFIINTTVAYLYDLYAYVVVFC